MVLTVPLVLMVAALVCLVLAAISVPAQRVSLGWLGMALWLLAQLLGGAIRP